MSAHSENVKKMVIWMLEAFGGPHARTIPIEVIDAMVERSENSADFLLEIRDRLPVGGAATESTLLDVRDNGTDANSWLESLFNAQRQVQLLTEAINSNTILADIQNRQGRSLVGTGNIIAANSVINLALPTNCSAVAVMVSGTYAGVTFAADISEDGTLFENGMQGFNSQSAVTATSFSPGTNGIKRYVFPVNNAGYLRLRATAWTSGNANIAVYALPTFASPTGIITTQAVTLAAPTTGGLARSRLLSAATTNATLVKSTAGQLYTIHGHNSAASDRYLKLYQKATAPIVGTDTPVETHVLKAGQPFRLDFTQYGNTFATGIAYAITANLPDNDTTAIGASEVVLVLHYK